MSSPEYLDFRCCMCPNRGGPDPYTCPAIPPMHPEASPCRFVKQYIDEHGYQYRVIHIGGVIYRVIYRMSDKSPWKVYRNIPWRDSFDETQHDLNQLAKQKGWMET